MILEWEAVVGDWKARYDVGGRHNGARWRKDLRARVGGRRGRVRDWEAVSKFGR
jgi:hypothetical protein